MKISKQLKNIITESVSKIVDKKLNEQISQDTNKTNQKDIIKKSFVEFEPERFYEEIYDTCYNCGDCFEVDKTNPIHIKKDNKIYNLKEIYINGEDYLTFYIDINETHFYFWHWSDFTLKEQKELCIELAKNIIFLIKKGAFSTF